MLFRKSKAPAAGALENDASTTTAAEEHQHQRHDQQLSSDEQKDGGKVAKTVSRASTRAESDYPTGVRLALILLSIFVSMFLVALDRLIISTVSATLIILFFYWHCATTTVSNSYLPYVTPCPTGFKLTFANRPSLKLQMISTRFRTSVGTVAPIS